MGDRNCLPLSISSVAGEEMTTNHKALSLVAVAALTLCSIFVSAQSAGNQNATQPSKQAARPTTTDPGELKFQQNCSRCHTAPQQFSSRIAGTIVQHMRVRASLSEKDARDILKYLAP